MGRLTTHVLDTANGKPGAGISGKLYRVGNPDHLLTEFQTNRDGRVDKPLMSEQEFSLGTYELVFSIGPYFSEGTEKPAGFLDDVVLRFSMTADEHYHVPLLVSPWSYTTYRGS